jgi:hypothetical protein
MVSTLRAASPAGIGWISRCVPARGRVPGDAARNVLTIAVTVGALALGQFYGPLLAGSLLGLPGARLVLRIGPRRDQRVDEQRAGQQRRAGDACR